MVIVNCLKYCPQLVYIHRYHRRKSPAQFHGIGINLGVKPAHILLQHGIIGIELPVKRKSLPRIPQRRVFRQLIGLVLRNLFCLLLYRLISHPVAHGFRGLHILLSGQFIAGPAVLLHPVSAHPGLNFGGRLAVGRVSIP